ncbi:MAG: restriction endonuclease subunit S [Nostoc sp.]|uniref:restriction endonuclease subunit S n=1 Tax=Nostoc sp. TaxID=1180 RepID=UPI002FF9AC64
MVNQLDDNREFKDSALGMIPKDWDVVKLSSVFQIKTGATPLRAKHQLYFVDGIIPWVKTMDLNEGGITYTDEYITERALKECSVQILPPKTLLIAMYGGWEQIGRTGILKIQATTNQAISSLIPISSCVESEFIIFALQFGRNRWKQVAVSTRKDPNITSNDVANFVIQLPPIPEQQQIAKILDTVDKAIAQTETLIAKYKRVKTGLMQDLLTRGIDEHGQLRDPSTHKFKRSPLGMIPDEWEIKLLSTVADVSSGVTLGRKVTGLGTIELPYLRVANVQDGYLDLSEVKTIHIYKEELSRYLLQPNDVLMNEGGDYDKLGRGTVWRGQIPLCLHQNHVFRVRPNIDYLFSDFLAFISASSYGKNFFILNSKQSTNLASINSTQLKSFPIPCPPVLEQKKIIVIYEKIEILIKIEQKKHDNLQKIKIGLMQDLLTGKTSVKPLLTNQP